MVQYSYEVNHTTIIIYAALCLGFTAILAGGQNKDIFKYRGEDVNLYCDFPVFIKLPNYQWYFTQHGGEERSLTNGTRYTWSCMQLSVSPSWLRTQIAFNNVTFNDSGTYTCELMSARGVDNKKEIQLTVLGLPVDRVTVDILCVVTLQIGSVALVVPPSSSPDLPGVTVQQTQIFIIVGEDVVLNCSVNGRGVPIKYVTWYKRSSSLLIPLTNERKYQRRQLGPDASLIIREAIENDAGMYVCEGTTEVGSSKGNDIGLKVGYKPTVMVNEYNYGIGLGDNLTLHCSIHGHGSGITRVEWLKEASSQMIYLQPSARVFWDISNPSIKINMVRLDDAGRYTCIGVTNFGRTNSSQISVQIFSTPSIISPAHEYKTINGTNAVLEVRIDDRMQTSLSVQWEKYNEENQQWFPLENNSRLIWTFAEPSLKIATALVDDDGKYRIIGKSAYYEVASSPITLTIDVPVKIKELATRPVLIRGGDTVELRCLVDGRPKPNVTWKLANGTTSSLTNVQDNILILKSVSNLNEGNYTCIAHNSFSSDESLIYMTVSAILHIHIAIFSLNHPVFNIQDKDLTDSPLEKYVVPGASVFVCVALIALIVVVILIRRKRQKGRTDQPNLEIRSTNGQQHPSPSENIGSENNLTKLSVHRFGDMTYPQMIRKSSKHIDGDKSIRDTGASKVYMNINNRSNSNSNNYINVEMETDNTQMNKTGELNYEALNFSYNAKEENIYLGIQGPHLTQRVQKK
ncbi:hypothetical protein ACJMK2_026639 [Sinanodonta woodiana]|uniref:Ig-like domain-containing protein n=1 Tax=Sinanodonta woodiana TaxID=1069815 RepID=A0ABD3XK69_SINWO